MAVDQVTLRTDMLGSFDRVKGSKFISNLLRAHRDLKDFNASRGIRPEDLTYAGKFLRPIVMEYFSVEGEKVDLADGVTVEDLVDLLSADVFSSPEPDAAGKTPLDVYIDVCGDRELIKEDIAGGQRITSDFYVRELKDRQSDDGVTYFEVSPVVDTPGQYKERLVVEVSANNALLLETVRRNQQKILSMELAALPSGNFRLVSCRSPEARNKAFNMKELSGQEVAEKGLRFDGHAPSFAWVETDSVDRDFTYTESLERVVGLHGQWCIADRHLETMQALQEGERFERFLAKAEAKCVGRSASRLSRGVLQNYVLAREGVPARDFLAYMESREKETMSSEWSESEKERFEALAEEIESLREEYHSFARDVPPPQNFGQMMVGAELHIEGSQWVQRPVIYDLDLSFSEQFSNPGNVETGDFKTTLFSQMRNYSYQMALRDLLVENSSSFTNVLIENEHALVAEGAVPMENPYLTEEDMDALNREHSQLVGSNLIAGIMRHQGAVPNQQMRSLMPGEVVDRFMSSLDYENLQNLELGEMLAATHQNLKGVLHRSKLKVIEVVETEAFAPGKSPRARAKAKLQETEAALQEKIIGAGIMANNAEGAIEAIESVSIFR
jgi:hypothetical protein